MNSVNVLFIANSNNKWMGGVYYVKNIVFQFLEYAKQQNETRYNIFIYLPKDIEDVFDFCKKYDNVTFLYKRNRPWSIGEGFFRRNIRELEWIFRIYLHKIDWVYPSFSPTSIYKKKVISWIPDFQHVQYPEFFSDSEVMFRDTYFKQIATEHSKLVLSSQDAYDTYTKLYPNNIENVVVVHFVSAIFEDDIDKNINSIFSKYEISSKKYYIISNQFYRHKNHLTVFKAIKKAKENNVNIQLLCTGLTQDIKDPNYWGEVEQYILQNHLEDNIKILGLIPRSEQLALMRDAIAVIQPSLFEGWGTCTEDAKVLGKKILLSDIPVHREQANDMTVFFKAKDENELAKLLIDTWNTEEKCNCYKIENAIEYGKQFAEILC